jgi:hypothetical protein
LPRARAAGQRQQREQPDRIVAPTLIHGCQVDAGLSAKTVARHRTNTLQKLELRGHLALTRYAIKAGLIEPWPANARTYSTRP